LYEQFFTIAQTVTDAGDPINHAATLAANAPPPIHFVEVIGDTVIPNIVASAPLSGTEPLAAELGLSAIDATVMGQSGLVRFSAGGHGSLLSPEQGLAPLMEMQRQVATFAASSGQIIEINDGSVIQPADMPPVPTEPETETETETEMETSE